MLSVKMRFLVSIFFFFFCRGNRAGLVRESGGCYLLCQGGLGWISGEDFSQGMVGYWKSSPGNCLNPKLCSAATEIFL